jgi:hypothetical protein
MNLFINNGFHINKLKNKINDYARPYQFYCYIDFPSKLGASSLIGDVTKVSYLVKSTVMPSSTIQPIKIEWQGQTYKFGSTHEFAPWNCQFYCDAGDKVRDLFTSWMHLIHNPSTNIQNSPKYYFGNVYIQHIDGSGNLLMTYQLQNAFPTTVGDATLDYSQRTTAMEFPVTFEFQYFTICSTGNNGITSSTDTDNC